jgi:hypothetical protein
MAFTVQDLTPTTVGQPTAAKPNEFNLPDKTFVGYDPKGTTTVTGSERVPPQAEVKVDTPPKAEDSVILPKKISALARQEMAQRAKEKAFADKERSFAEKMADADKFVKLREAIKNKDYSQLDELGVKYEEIVKHELNKEASKDPVQDEIKSLKQKQEELVKRLEEKEVKEYETNQTLWKSEIARVLAENKEFAALKKANANQAILDHINDSFEEDGTELTVEQAAKDLIGELENKKKAYDSYFEDETPAQDKPQAGKVLGPPKTEVKTITQNMTVTSHQTKPKPFHLMSESEQIAEAIRRVQAEKLKRQG